MDRFPQVCDRNRTEFNPLDTLAAAILIALNLESVPLENHTHIYIYNIEHRSHQAQKYYLLAFTDAIA